MPVNNYLELSDLVASAARTASGNSSELAQSFAAIEDLRVQLEITAVSGTTPTLDVTIEDTLDGTNWNTIGTFTQKTAAGLQVIDIAKGAGKIFSRRLRVKWVIGGTTPSFTFNIDAVGR